MSVLLPVLSIGCDRAEPLGGPRSAPVIELGAPASDASLNGCTPETAVEAHDALVVVIRFGGELGHNFQPACLRVRRGSLVRFVGPFELHPLVPGRVFEGSPIDEAGPVRAIREGERATFMATTAGAFGFYCDLHVAEGMMGGVYVSVAEARPDEPDEPAVPDESEESEESAGGRGSAGASQIERSRDSGASARSVLGGTRARVVRRPLLRRGAGLGA